MMFLERLILAAATLAWVAFLLWTVYGELIL